VCHVLTMHATMYVHLALWAQQALILVLHLFLCHYSTNQSVSNSALHLVSPSGKVGGWEKWFRLHEGDIHSHIHAVGRRVIASITLLAHSVAQEETAEGAWVQFGALVLVKMHIDHTPKYSGREPEESG
jgi:hypothetical protein